MQLVVPWLDVLLTLNMKSASSLYFFQRLHGSRQFFTQSKMIDCCSNFANTLLGPFLFRCFFLQFSGLQSNYISALFHCYDLALSQILSFSKTTNDRGEVQVNAEYVKQLKHFHSQLNIFTQEREDDAGKIIKRNYSQDSRVKISPFAKFES